MSRIGGSGAISAGTFVPASRMKAVRFVTSTDGTALAWTRSGSGPALVRPANWLTHLEYDEASPIWAHWVRFLIGNFDLVRYDERGCGLSDRDPGRLGIEQWLDDLDAVIGASGIGLPVAMLGVSHGAAAAIAYASRWPDRVSHLVLYGGYARGVFRRGDQGAGDLYRSIVNVFRLGFDQSNPAFQEVLTSRFIPDADEERRAWFNELCRRTVAPDAGAELLLARGDLDVSDALAGIRAPTLVIHSRDDAVTPLAESEFLARRIPGARLAVLESRNHILQADEPAWPELKRLVLEFIGANESVRIENLTPRETEILRLICKASSNKQIARDLGLSEKTVRNHASHIFSKLGVTTRQEAIVAASRHFPEDRP